MLNLINSLLPVLCLCIGFYFGFNMKIDKKIDIPRPIKYFKAKRKEKQEEKVIKEEIDYLNDVLYNIENYDGTGIGQKTIKRGVNS